MELELQKGTSYWVAKIYHVKDSPRMKGYLNASIEGSQKGYPTANGPSNFQIGHMNVIPIKICKENLRVPKLQFCYIL